MPNGSLVAIALIFVVPTATTTAQRNGSKDVFCMSLHCASEHKLLDKSFL
jgi:hypothetical protein